MSSTIAAPNFMLRRIVAVVALALVATALAAGVAAGAQATFHIQILPGGTHQVSGYDGGAPLLPGGGR